jgi:hypothetical protein
VLAMAARHRKLSGGENIAASRRNEHASGVRSPEINREVRALIQSLRPA